MVKLHSTINLAEANTGKIYSLPTIPSEKISVVKQTGGNIVIKVVIKILKSPANSIHIVSDEKSEKYAEQIKLALEDLIGDLSKENIVLSGSMIELNEGLIHPTDFNSIKVRRHFYNYFQNLLEKVEN